MDSKPLLVFPKWANKATVGILLGVATVPVYVGMLLVYGANPTTLNVGYSPVQPVPYSHALHVGKLGLDCRYCHTAVEKGAKATLPPTEVCLNCHKAILPNSVKLAEVRRSYTDGTPVPWVKVHVLPDFVYFNHSAHVSAGVGCRECHGPVHQIQVVETAKPLNMAWCLECHRKAEPYLRPRDQVTNMDWTAESAKGMIQTSRGESADDLQAALGKQLKEQYHLNPNTDCVTCHR